MLRASGSVLGRTLTVRTAPRRLLVPTVLAVVGLAVGWLAGHQGWPVGHQARASAASPESPTYRVFPAPVKVDTSVGTNLVWRVQSSDKVVALTFDDGPDPDGTPAVLRVLAAHHATATFFELGEDAQANPQVVQQVLAAGDEVGVHGWSHTAMTHQDEPTIEADLDRAAGVLRDAGADVRLFRPPYGKIDSLALGAAATRGWTVALWSDRFDENSDVDRLVQRLQPGAIVLCHDGRGHANPALLDNLDALLTALDQAGYQYVTVSDLLASSQSADQ